MSDLPRGEDSVFKALSDPTRREILDRLRHRPATTGDIASGFTLSRFGVMKHLKVLQEAGLVLVEARGRERWNRVNPLPIRSIYRRWILPFEEEASDRLLRLKGRLETPETPPNSDNRKENPMSTEQTTAELGADERETLRAIDLSVEVDIEATVSRVWEGLVDEIGSWWHPDFHTGPEPRSFQIEPSLGGRMFEDFGDGNGLIWGIVNGIRRNQMLQVVGDTSRAWGGPSRGIMTWTLSEVDGGTRLRFEQSQFGRVTEETVKSLEGGWRFLFSRCLKPWIESGQDPSTVSFDGEDCAARA